jgi:hypothetical protein
VQCLPELGVLAHAVAVAADRDDVAVVDEAIDERRRHDLVAKDRAPLFKALVGRQDGRRVLVPAVPMRMRGLTPAIEVEVEGRPLLFTLDTGASSTDLSVRYYELFRAHAGSWKTQVAERWGAGGSIQLQTYIQPRVVMNVGTRAVTLDDVSILPVRLNADLDTLFGNLGRDFFDGVGSFSLNFATMTFSVGAPERQ